MNVKLLEKTRSLMQANRNKVADCGFVIDGQDRDCVDSLLGLLLDASTTKAGLAAWVCYAANEDANTESEAFDGELFEDEAARLLDLDEVDAAFLFATVCQRDNARYLVEIFDRIATVLSKHTEDVEAIEVENLLDEARRIERRLESLERCIATVNLTAMFTRKNVTQSAHAWAADAHVAALALVASLRSNLQTARRHEQPRA